MRVFSPQRNRIALDVNNIQDEELKKIMTSLASLQKESNQMYNGLSEKIGVAEQELQTMIRKMNETNNNLNELIDSLKTQMSNLVSNSVEYLETTNLGLEDPKFRASFVYLLKEIMGNLSQTINTLKEKAEFAITEEPVTESEENFEIESESFISPNMTPEPSEISRTSSIRIAAVYQEIMQSVENIKPIVESAQNRLTENQEMMNQLQEVMDSVKQKEVPEIEESEAFSPEFNQEEINEDETKEWIPEEEVEEVMKMEEDQEATEDQEETPETEEEEEVVEEDQETTEEEG